MEGHAILKLLGRTPFQLISTGFLLIPVVPAALYCLVVLKRPEALLPGDVATVLVPSTVTVFAYAYVLPLIYFWFVHSIARRYPDLEPHKALAERWLRVCTLMICVAMGLFVFLHASMEGHPEQTELSIAGLSLVVWFALLPHAAAKVLPRFEVPVTPEQLYLENLAVKPRPFARWDYPIAACRHRFLFVVALCLSLFVLLFSLYWAYDWVEEYTMRYLYYGDFAYPRISGPGRGYQYVEHLAGTVQDPYKKTLFEEQLAFFRSWTASLQTQESVAWSVAFAYGILSTIATYIRRFTGKAAQKFGWWDVLAVGVGKAARVLFVVFLATATFALLKGAFGRTTNFAGNASVAVFWLTIIVLWGRSQPDEGEELSSGGEARM